MYLLSLNLLMSLLLRHLVLRTRRTADWRWVGLGNMKSTFWYAPTLNRSTNGERIIVSLLILSLTCRPCLFENLPLCRQLQYQDLHLNHLTFYYLNRLGVLNRRIHQQSHRMFNVPNVVLVLEKRRRSLRTPGSLIQLNRSPATSVGGASRRRETWTSTIAQYICESGNTRANSAIARLPSSTAWIATFRWCTSTRGRSSAQCVCAKFGMPTVGCARSRAEWGSSRRATIGDMFALYTTSSWRIESKSSKLWDIAHFELLCPVLTRSAIITAILNTRNLLEEETNGVFDKSALLLHISQYSCERAAFTVLCR